MNEGSRCGIVPPEEMRKRRNYTTMAPVKFGVEVIKSFLRKHKIATLVELKHALGPLATMTVFRKLKALGYRTSFSHRGKYYTLTDIPQFDEQGLWSHRAV